MSTRLSVAMMTYNGERYVEAQLRSILEQDPPPFELVIADDGSSDSTIDIITSMIESAAFPVRIVGGQHVGLLPNVSRALTDCRGDAIALCDQDDVWLPGRVGAIVRAFEDAQCTLWFSDAELIDAAGNVINSRAFELVHLDADARDALRERRSLQRLLHASTVVGATMAFRKSVLEIALPLPVESATPRQLFLHDGWIALIASLLGTVEVEEQPFTQYRRHPAQFTHVASAEPAGSRPKRFATHAEVELQGDRIKLIRARLVNLNAFDRMRPQDAISIQELHALYLARTSPPGARRILRILNAASAGFYTRYARGWKTALADVVVSRG